MRESPDTRCAVIALAGKPNSGKSTLLNAIVGAKLAITSAKPQSTRQSVVGIHTEGETQLVFVDPPGLLEPRYLLQQAMMEQVMDALRGADAILHLSTLADGAPPPLEELVPADALKGQPVATVLTGADLVPPHERPATAPPTFLVGATTGEGVEEVLEWCREQARPGAFRYDPEDISTQPLRFFVAEFVREAAFELLDEELPYALAAEVDEFREDSDPVYIRVTVHVERESQKGIVIGSNGRTIKQLGALARQSIEHLLGKRVFLDLWVKVLPKWRRSPQRLRELGFPLPGTRNT
jgi:GTP-binding protein Era